LIDRKSKINNQQSPIQKGTCMEFEQQPIYEAPQPPRPVVWMGLTAFFALCCCCFAFIAVGEGAWFALGGDLTTLTGGDGTSSTGKPTLGKIGFCIEQPDLNTACSPTTSKVPTSTKTIYVTFEYKNMPKSSTYAYDWSLNDETVSTKEKVKWPKDTNGVAQIKLDVSKPGDYRLTITPTSGDEKTATIKVGQ
jgi:hypothetical protein